MGKRQAGFPWRLLLICTLSLSGPAPLRAQGVDLADRPVSDVRIDGLKQATPQLVLNQVRLRKGDPYSARTVQEDIVRLTHLGRFGSVTARAEPQNDGSVVVTYVVAELAVLTDVQVVGNKAITDQELLGLAQLRAGDPVDPFLIDRAAKQIKMAYEKQGYFQVEVTPDQEQLRDSGILVLQVREGPSAAIRDLRFEGNAVYTSDQLASKIRSQTAFALFWVLPLRKGELNREQLEQDAARLRDFYRDNGYLDAQVGRRIDVSPDQQDAVVTFVIHEGRQFTVRSVKVEGNVLYSVPSIIQAMPLKVGDVFSADKARKSLDAVTDLYGKLGFIEARVVIERLFEKDQPVVDLLVRVAEGVPYTVGRVTVAGNTQTQDKVVLRQVRGLRPGRRFDRAGLEETQKRLKESPFFSDANVTVLGDPDEVERDVLIEVREKQTGSLSIGAGVSSDLGVIGSFEVLQRNFDIADWPESFDEFLSGKAFRGAGQSFGLAVQPGADNSRYSVSFREPHFLETDFSFDGSAFYVAADRDEYDEARLGTALGLGHRFGDVWSAVARLRAENIEIDQLAPDAPVDVVAVKGQSTLTTLALVVARNTTDSRLFPTSGSALEVALSQAGALAGDYTFSEIAVSYQKFWTVDEDFFGRRTVLTFRGQAGYIFAGDAPLFERFYLGGRSFRGFAYRGIGPRGLIDPDGVPNNGDESVSDQHVGGNWLLFAGLEYNFPVYEDVIRMVVFADTGTVEEDLGLDAYRLSLGAGVRIKIPFLGQAPFALDLAVPLLEEQGDDTLLFSFSLDLPLR